MKTQSLTPWCNIYYSALKYNISVTSSRYKAALIALLVLLFLLLFLIQNTIYYTAALIIIVIFGLLLDFYLNNYRKKPTDSLRQFQLSTSGLVDYHGADVHCVYQLLPQSRCSFLGAWLVMEPVNSPLEVHSTYKRRDTLLSQFKPIDSGKKHCMFIFKDSFSQADYSHLSRVINSLVTLN